MYCFKNWFFFIRPLDLSSYFSDMFNRGLPHLKLLNITYWMMYSLLRCELYRRREVSLKISNLICAITYETHCKWVTFWYFHDNLSEWKFQLHNNILQHMLKIINTSFICKIRIWELLWNLHEKLNISTVFPYIIPLQILGKPMKTHIRHVIIITLVTHQTFDMRHVRKINRT